jgi:membrane-bound inhibitor of C-type lysozyme
MEILIRMESLMMLRYCRGLGLAAGLASTLVAGNLALADGIPAKSFAYQCEDGTRLSATFSPPEQAEGSVRIAFDGAETTVLPQAISADGGRYVKDDVEFWIKGKGATLTIAGKTTNCTTND